MDFREIIKKSSILIGFSAAGKWDGDIVYPIPELWTKAYEVMGDQAERIIGVCLPPRSDHYYYTCGAEIEAVNFYEIHKGMTLHTFPEQKYVVFKHIGPAKDIPKTYGQVWKIFDIEGYHIKKGMPEIEIVEINMFGKEETDEYEMEIWIPVE